MKIIRLLVTALLLLLSTIAFTQQETSPQAREEELQEDNTVYNSNARYLYVIPTGDGDSCADCLAPGGNCWEFDNSFDCTNNY